MTVSTLWFAVSLIVVFLLGWSMGYGNGRGECLELDDAIYCPRHARGRMSEGEWQLRWGNSIHPADAAHKPWGVTDE